MKTKDINLKSKGVDIRNIVTNYATTDGCYYSKAKTSKEVNDRLRSYGYTTADIRQFLNLSNFEAKTDAINEANKRNRGNTRFWGSRQKQLDYSAKLYSVELLSIDENGLSDAITGFQNEN